jgi:hypothetical protein
MQQLVPHPSGRMLPGEGLVHSLADGRVSGSRRPRFPKFLKTTFSKTSEVFQQDTKDRKEFILHKPTIPAESPPATRPHHRLPSPHGMVSFPFCKVYPFPSGELAQTSIYPSLEGGKIVPVIRAKTGEVGYTQDV